jgi:RNA polymerase sigma-70 factor, ECF subfamily
MKASVEFERELVSLIPFLRTIAWQYQDAVDTLDDLVQYTLEKALRYHYQFRVGEDLRPWLAQIMINRHRTNRRRESSVVRNAGSEPLLYLTVPPRQEDAVYLNEVMQVVGRLPQKSKDEVFSLIGGVTDTEASITLGIAVGTIKSRRFRARKKLENMGV